MGMYTEFHYNVELPNDTPTEVIQVLEAMVAGCTETIVELPDHQFFRATRWRHLFTSDSYYFAADTIASLRHDKGSGYYLCVRSNIKNYDHEIERFVDWLEPYVDAYDDDLLGFWRYEESREPNLIRKRGQ